MTESEFNKNKKEMLEKSFVVVEQVLINGMKLRSFIKDDEVVKEALVKALAIIGEHIFDSYDDYLKISELMQTDLDGKKAEHTRPTAEAYEDV